MTTNRLSARNQNKKRSLKFAFLLVGRYSSDEAHSSETPARDPRWVISHISFPFFARSWLRRIRFRLHLLKDRSIFENDFLASLSNKLLSFPIAGIRKPEIAHCCHMEGKDVYRPSIIRSIFSFRKTNQIMKKTSRFFFSYRMINVLFHLYNDRSNGASPGSSVLDSYLPSSLRPSVSLFVEHFHSNPNSTIDSFNGQPSTDRSSTETIDGIQSDDWRIESAMVSLCLDSI